MIFGRKDKTTEPPAPAREGDRPGETWVSRLGLGLGKSSAKLGQDLTDLFTKKKLDQETLDGLEEALITADLGPKTAARIVGEFAEGRFGKDLGEEEIREALANVIANILAPVAIPLVPSIDSLSLRERDGVRVPDIEGHFEDSKPSPNPLPQGEGSKGPFVILVCGVNGAGKTTTIGKLATQWIKNDHRKVMIAAGDTFRAAAVEQLKIWADRSGAMFVAKETGADAAAVAYEAYAEAKKQNADILMIDTAGRLHNKSNLMAELEKIIRVLKKHDEAIPHATLLVLDATTGQNAHAQVETFKEMTKVTGLIVTKLDGSAKGGVVVGLADHFGLPIHAVGVGEGADDLQPFDPQDYARSLVGLAS